jgi:hypothetical protein
MIGSGFPCQIGSGRFSDIVVLPLRQIRRDHSETAARIDAVGGRRARVLGARHAFGHSFKVSDRLARREYVNKLAVPR